MDGTIDTTRTFHFGDPDKEVIERYTWVLMGAIDLARTVVYRGNSDTTIDIQTRQHLFREGLDYRHGTGHGIGAYGGVHENPTSIRMGGTPEYLYENMFFSDEPGYYKDGAYGIRLETVLYGVKKDFDDADDSLHGFIGFEPVALVPFEPKLINFTMMTRPQIEWYNDYNSKIREVISPYFEQRNRDDVLEWLESKTFYVDHRTGEAGAAYVSSSIMALTLSIVTVVFSKIC